MSVLKKPHNTEKMTLLVERAGNNQYAFIVDRNAEKPAIKSAIESLYDVKVVSLRTMNYAGKKRSRYTKAGIISGKSANFKKAVVTLSEGDEIDFYKNI